MTNMATNNTRCQNTGCPSNTKGNCTLSSVLAGNQWCDSFDGEPDKPWVPSKWKCLSDDGGQEIVL